MEPSTIFRLRSDVRYRLLFSKAVVVRQSSLEVLALNESGARVLELVASGVTAEALISTMLEEYEVSRAALQEDVSSFLQELQEAGVVESTTA
ncbi:MAG: PqqD family protein [Acidobacteriota bacterium]